MNEMQIFKHEAFGSVRTVMVDGVPWFVGKDVANILGYAKARNAISSHVDFEDKKDAPIQGPLGGVQQMTIINESGLYSLILSSKLPTAKQFKRWVTSEVLPAVREHGGYLTLEKAEEVLLNPDTIIELATQIKEKNRRIFELETENEVQRQAILDFEPKKRYLDEILTSKATVTTTQIAADYNLTANKLNRILKEERIQRKVGGQWILYSGFMGRGYTMSETIHIVRSDGRPDVVMTTKWTQKGRLMIHNLLERKGILPVSDIEM